MKTYTYCYTVTLENGDTKQVRVGRATNKRHAAEGITFATSLMRPRPISIEFEYKELEIN